MFDFIGVTVLLAVAALTTWLGMRAWRATNRILGWIGVVLSVLVALSCSLVIALSFVGFYKINFPPDRPRVTDVRVAGTPAQVARGAKFGEVCGVCHSPDGKPPLVGHDFWEGAQPPQTIFAANLTAAGEIKNWSDGEIVRAIREGVHKSGRALIIMPSAVFHNLSDVDVQAIVAYLRSQPAIQPNTPPTKLNALAAALIGAGLARTSVQPPIAEPVVAPAEGTSADYGKYLVSILRCQECHGENLAGHRTGGAGFPAAPNLTLLVPKWTAEEFTRTFRTGVDPYNHTIVGMPWKTVSAFATEEDLKAMYAYLHGLTSVELRDN